MSEIIKISATDKTPELCLDDSKGMVSISGRSIPEDSLEFYRPIIQWLEQYAASPQPETNIHIRFEHFNTSTSRSMLEVFRKLQNIYQQGNKVNVYWHYEEDDEDMMEAGEDYRSLLGLPFHLVEG